MPDYDLTAEVASPEDIVQYDADVTGLDWIGMPEDEACFCERPVQMDTESLEIDNPIIWFRMLEGERGVDVNKIDGARCKTLRETHRFDAEERVGLYIH